jgi:hypothetical protein
MIVEVLYAPHHWSMTGNKRTVEHLKNQRDLYRINDQPLRLANHGYHMTEIAETLSLPKSLQQDWSVRGYYGSVNHDLKSTFRGLRTGEPQITIQESGTSPSLTLRRPSENRLPPHCVFARLLPVRGPNLRACALLRSLNGLRQARDQDVVAVHCRT